MAKVTIERIERARQKKDEAYQALKELVVQSVNDGILLRDAARAAGVTYETMRLWRLEAGDAIDARRKGTAPAETKQKLAKARRTIDQLRSGTLPPPEPAKAKKKAPAKKKTSAPAADPSTKTTSGAAKGQTKTAPVKKTPAKAKATKKAPVQKKTPAKKLPVQKAQSTNGHGLTTAQKRRLEAAEAARARKLAAAGKS